MMDAAGEVTEVVQLVSQAEDGSLQVCEAGVRALQRVSGPVRCVCIAGLYRSGKSFLQNRLLASLPRSPSSPAPSSPTTPGSPSSRARFQVGGSTESCTRGIWMAVSGDFVVLDSEGLASLDQDATYDAKIFTLGLLLSSYFVYNTTGVIDEAAIDRLHLVGRLAQQISKSSKIAFQLLWCLRDFSLDIAAQYGDDRASAASAYLEAALADRVKGDSAPRRELRRIFRHRKCVTLVRPVAEESDLQRLDDMPVAEMRPEFCRQLDAALELIRSETKVKTMGGQPMNGPAMAKFLSACVQSINGGAVPDVKKLFAYVADETLREAQAAAEKLYDDAMDAVSCAAVGPDATAGLAAGTGLAAGETAGTAEAESGTRSWADFIEAHEATRAEAASVIQACPFETAAKAGFLEALHQHVGKSWRRHFDAIRLRSAEAARAFAAATSAAATSATATSVTATSATATSVTATSATATPAKEVDALAAPPPSLGPERHEVLLRHLASDVVKARLLPRQAHLGQELAHRSALLEDASRRLEEAAAAADVMGAELREERAALGEARGAAAKAEAARAQAQADADMLRGEAEDIIRAAGEQQEEFDLRIADAEEGLQAGEVRAVLDDVLAGVEATLLRSERNRFQEERCALHERLQDYLQRIATLPDFYQEQLFNTNPGRLDLYGLNG